MIILKNPRADELISYDYKSMNHKDSDVKAFLDDLFKMNCIVVYADDADLELIRLLFSINKIEEYMVN